MNNPACINPIQTTQSITSSRVEGAANVPTPVALLNRIRLVGKGKGVVAWMASMLWPSSKGTK